MPNWQEDEGQPFSYWLCLRHGTAEWNARMCVPKDILITLEHGKMYVTKDLSIPNGLRTGLKIPDKVQFIVEKLHYGV